MDKVKYGGTVVISKNLAQLLAGNVALPLPGYERETKSGVTLFCASHTPKGCRPQYCIKVNAVVEKLINADLSRGMGESVFLIRFRRAINKLDSPEE